MPRKFKKLILRCSQLAAKNWEMIPLEFFGDLEKPINLLNAEAFEANQKGEITASQRARLGDAAGWKYIALMGAAAILLGGLIVFVLQMMLRGIFDGLICLLTLVFLSLLFGLGNVIWKQINRTLTLKRDMADSAIRQGQGQLVVRKGGYVFDLGDRLLHVALNNANGLFPAAMYQVCYLEESGFLLSAALVGDVPPLTTVALPPRMIRSLSAHSRQQLNQALATANQFTQDDLLANKNGQISLSQRKSLDELLKFARIKTVLLGLVCFIGTPLFTYTLPLGLTVLLATSFFLVYFTAFLAYSVITLMLDLHLAKVCQIEGEVYKEHKRSYFRGATHIKDSYIIHEKKFRVYGSAYEALVDGQYYCIYYMPNTKTLLSIEAIERPVA